MKRTKMMALGFAIFLAIAGPRFSLALDPRAVTCITAALIMIVLLSFADDLKTR